MSPKDIPEQVLRTSGVASSDDRPTPSSRFYSMETARVLAPRASHCEHVPGTNADVRDRPLERPTFAVARPRPRRPPAATMRWPHAPARSTRARPQARSWAVQVRRRPAAAIRRGRPPCGRSLTQRRRRSSSVSIHPPRSAASTARRRSRPCVGSSRSSALRAVHGADRCTAPPDERRHDLEPGFMGTFGYRRRNRFW